MGATLDAVLPLRTCEAAAGASREAACSSCACQKRPSMCQKRPSVRAIAARAWACMCARAKQQERRSNRRPTLIRFLDFGYALFYLFPPFCRAQRGVRTGPTAASPLAPEIPLFAADLTRAGSSPLWRIKLCSYNDAPICRTIIFVSASSF